jgi:hypothetical protein
MMPDYIKSIPIRIVMLPVLLLLATLTVLFGDMALGKRKFPGLWSK